MIANEVNEDLLPLTATIVAAHAGNNTLKPHELPALIDQVYRALAGLGQPIQVVSEKREPAVPVKKSVFPDYVICLEDGKRLKMLRRHLKTSYGLTPDEYRQRWGLPADYPMVAPNYAKQRSALARKIGLGTRAIPTDA